MPQLKQPPVRSGLGRSKRLAVEVGRSHSFGALACGSLLRLHDMGIQKINEEDEDQLPSTRRNHQPDRPLSNGNTKKSNSNGKKNEKSGGTSSDSSSSSFTDGRHSASDSPEAID